METRIALFIALVFLVLFWNTLLLWFIYRALARSANQIPQYQRHCYQLIKGLGVALEKVEVASGRAAEWSGQLRESAVDAGGNVERAENWLGYGMAKLDFTVDKISKQITDEADRIKAAVSEPLFRTGSVVHGIKAFLELLPFSQANHEERPPRS
jgi:hypothetical protein